MTLPRFERLRYSKTAASVGGMLLKLPTDSVDNRSKKR